MIRLSTAARFPLITGARILLALALVGCWQVVSTTTQVFPPVVPILKSFANFVTTAGLWEALGLTIWAWVLGLVVSTILGITLGAAIGSTEFGYRSAAFVVEFVRGVPAVAYLPATLLIFGTEIEMKLALIIATCTTLMLIQAAYGVRDVDPVARQTLRTFRIPKRQVIGFLVLPSALPYLMAGLRVCAMMALLMTIGAEMVTLAPGLGRIIQVASGSGGTEDVYALALFAGFLGLGVHVAFLFLERMVVRWQPASRGEGA